MSDEDGGLSHLLDHPGAPASDATLRSIVARSHRRRERRLKIATATVLVVALAGASAGAITATSGGKGSGFVNVAAGSAAWTRSHTTPGVAPKGLKWSVASSSGAGTN